MIDSIGRGGPPPRLDRATGPGRFEVASKPAPAPDAGPVRRLARDLAASPPVDSARVAALRAGIADGSFRVDPLQIAGRMLALETGTR